MNIDKLALESKYNPNVVGCIRSMQCNDSYDYIKSGKDKKSLIKECCNNCSAFKYYHKFNK